MLFWKMIITAVLDKSYSFIDFWQLASVCMYAMCNCAYVTKYTWHHWLQWHVIGHHHLSAATERSIATTR